VSQTRSDSRPKNRHYQRFNKETINAPNLLLVEGQDDFQFFHFLTQRADLQIHVYEGKDQLQLELQTLKAVEGFDDLKRAIIVRDADLDPNAALRSVAAQWGNAFQENQPNADAETWFQDREGREWSIWIIPGSNTTGDLEELLWRAVSHSDHRDCIEKLMTCLESFNGPPFDSKTKARLYSWLATQKEPVTQLYVALAGKIPLFDPSHPVFERYRQLIDQI
jgi:hypothetical protein